MTFNLMFVRVFEWYMYFVYLLYELFFFRVGFEGSFFIDPVPVNCLFIIFVYFKVRYKGAGLITWRSESFC